MLINLMRILYLRTFELLKNWYRSTRGVFGGIRNRLVLMNGFMAWVGIGGQCPIKKE